MGSPVGNPSFRWQQRVIHLFDRGYAGAPWLAELTQHQLRFIMRWPTRHRLVDAQGQERLPGEIESRNP